MAVLCPMFKTRITIRPTTHSLTNLLSKRTLTAKIISHQARPIPQPPSSSTTPQPQHLILFDTIYISSTNFLLDQVETLFSILFISGSSRAAQNNNYFVQDREGKGKGWKGTGQAGIGR